MTNIKYCFGNHANVFAESDQTSHAKEYGGEDEDMAKKRVTKAKIFIGR